MSDDLCIEVPLGAILLSGRPKMGTPGVLQPFCLSFRSTSGLTTHLHIEQEFSQA